MQHDKGIMYRIITANNFTLLEAQLLFTILKASIHGPLPNIPTSLR